MLLMLGGSDDQGNNNWSYLLESNKKYHLQVAMAWLQQLSNSPPSPEALQIPPPTSDSSEVVAMSTNPMIQSSEDQFLHWRQDIKRKQDVQARQMNELQGHAKCL